jgi:hypothetical protein
MLKAMFPAGRFGPPASHAQIEEAEAVLGVRLPEKLRNLYLECDGFREPLGNATYLMPLGSADDASSLVGATLFWWHDWKEVQTDAIDFTPFVFFGSSGGDENWAIRVPPPHDIIAYHHHMGYAWEPMGDSIIGVYQRDVAEYKALDRS